MKNIVKIAVLGLLVSFTSCSDSEVLIDQVYDTVDTESGVILRSIVRPAELVSITNPANNMLNMTVEVQQGNGSFYPDFKAVRVNARVYADQDLNEPITTDAGAEIPEFVLASYVPTEFEISSNGLPRIDISIPVQEVADFYSDATLTPPSFIALRLEVEMNDGTVWTNTDVGVTISGGIYFNSPFLYRIIFLPI